jgi:hypothetical protein
MGGWRKLHSKGHCLYFSPSGVSIIKSRRVRWVGHIAHRGEMRYVCKILVEEPQRKMSLGRLRHRWQIILVWSLEK